MKNTLLALALFAFVGTAVANNDPGKNAKGKKAKKEVCAKGMASGCCMRGGATATVATKVPVAAPVTKSL